MEGKYERRRPLGRLNSRWEDNLLKWILKKQDIRWVLTAFMWFRTDQWWALVNTVINIRVP
jgi:hypothetical protein